MSTAIEGPSRVDRKKKERAQSLVVYPNRNKQCTVKIVKGFECVNIKKENKEFTYDIIEKKKIRKKNKKDMEEDIGNIYVTLLNVVNKE
mmetsp:Transcript_16620/g.21641  ORF Transcript_16620/g.21641 Transcript_16620/m.21641 type:complete len:89 (+) Transcript_16620:223-489(+)